MSEGREPAPPRANRLKKRLGYLQPSPPARGTGPLPPEKPPAGAGWERVGEYTWRRRVRRRIPVRIGQETGFSPHLVPTGLEADRIMVYDTETTGLSGGAGSLIFLMGTGRLEAGEACYEQIFLADFPGEARFLELVAERLAGAGLLVSYNGKSFDSHLLRTRFALAGRECVLGEQLDLLYWARRLWKRILGDCSLGNVERRVLGVRRGRDIPGYEIPGVYLDYLKTGEGRRLGLVFEHNLQDLDSLFRLLFLCNSLLVSERSPVHADEAALGNYLLGRMDDRGVSLLARSFRDGDQRAGKVLSLYYKRSKRWAEAAAVWEKMAAEAGSLFAVVELAKYYEHRRHEPAAALKYVESVSDRRLPLGPAERRDLEKRKRRLKLKIEKTLSNGSS